MSLVDVGMPAHGEPRFLEDAVRSVLAQSHRDLRLFIFDDSGDSRIEQVLQPLLEDGRVDYRKVEPISAPGVMTALIQAGTAPFFAFLHDDDRWEADFLRRRIDFLEAHPDCGLVISGHADIDERGVETARFPAPFKEGMVPPDWIVPEMQRRPVVDVMHCALLRRTALEAAGPWLDEDFPRVFDWELWLRVVLNTGVGCIDAEDAQYRAHDLQMSFRPGRARDFRRMLEHADELVSSLAPDLRLSEEERRARLARIELSESLDRAQEGDAKAARQALRRAMHNDLSVIVRDRRFMPAALVGFGGPPMRKAVAKLRTARWRRLQARRSGSRA
ncbi:MAG TPA: glycosyltransferase [Solirubrobacterales bacterium]